MINRRTLIQGSAATLAGTMVAPYARGKTVDRFQELPAARDERWQMLTATAIDAAMSAGARYADARLTFTQDMVINANMEIHGWSGPGTRVENLHFGVRAQYDGYWGFSSSPVLDKDEAARLGRDAVAAARANVIGKPRSLEMAPNPNATSGDWTMPVAEDPFEMHVDEIFDYLAGLRMFMGQINKEMFQTQKVRLEPGVEGIFQRRQKSFGSSDGQFITQRLYRTGGNISWKIRDGADRIKNIEGTLNRVRQEGAGMGFEYLRHPQMRDWIRELYTELAEIRHLPIVPLDVGRYTTLVPADAMAILLKPTVGVATEIDRIMGYEANATGTSYINEPEEMIGSLKIGNSRMNVTGTRSLPGGLSSVKWDDEGVQPVDFALIKDGVLNEVQTNREGAGWLKEMLPESERPLRSLGCSQGWDASDPQVVHPVDMVLQPDSTRDTTLDQLRAEIDKGIEFWTAGGVPMDFQQSTGMLIGQAVKIEKGKRVARLIVPGALFRTPELWGNLEVLGGPGSMMRVGTIHGKGEPLQIGYSTVKTPPAVFKDMSIINPVQKA